jgi:Fic family protein
MEKYLIGEHHQYTFAHSFKRLELAELDLVANQDDQKSDEKFQESYSKVANWNIRQHRALILMARGEAFKVSDYAKTFKVSTMTALRDLKELHLANAVKVYGKARATTYAL